MLRLEVLSLLFAVITLVTARDSLHSLLLGKLSKKPQVGPFHSAVDDFGQAYFVSQLNPTAPVPLGPFQKYLSSQSLKAIPASLGATHIIFVASNNGRWSSRNPAMFIFTTDPTAPQQFVSDASWYCKGYGETSGVTQENWPKLDNAGSLISEAMIANTYQQWPKAVELSPNFIFNWKTQESIPLQANYVWAAGLETNNPENPPRNAICVKKLA